MIIGERFAWGHLAKTGGDATVKYFVEVVPDLVVHADDRKDRTKHQPFPDRGPVATEKPILALNLRRLPHRTLSVAQHRSRYPLMGSVKRGEGKREPAPLELEKYVKGSQGDDKLRRFTDNGRLTISSWLRMEHLRDDFVTFVSQFREMTPEEVAKLDALQTKRSLGYDTTLSKYYTAEDIRGLYERNPIWAQVELEVYGGLFELPEVAPAPSLEPASEATR